MESTVLLPHGSRLVYNHVRSYAGCPNWSSPYVGYLHTSDIETQQEVITSSASGTRAPAPGRLELVRAFVNTVDLESGAEDLTSPAAVAEWLAARGLLPAGVALDATDLAEALAVREALREVLEANGGRPTGAEAGMRLQALAASVTLRLRFSPEPRLEPMPGGAGAATAGLLGIVFEAMANGSWPRLKVCRSDTCRWAFYDASRNRSGAWCSMAICGNRTKSRAFRRRRASATSAAR